MQVTLKKAAELSRALIAASKAIQPKTHTAISVYGSADVATAVDAGAAQLKADLSRALTLLDAGYALRSMISSANCENSIDAMLTEIAKLDEQITRLTDVEKVTYDGDPMSPDDMDAVTVRVATARADATNTVERRYAYQTSVDVGVMLPAFREDVARQIGSLKRSRIALKDKVTLANFNHTIAIPGGIETALRAASLID